MKPILFLDFDGVLNSATYMKQVQRGWNKLDYMAVGRVNKIVDATGCDVVISSSWRLDAERPGETKKVRLERILRENGGTFTVLGVTPYLTSTREFGMCRGDEIQAWLDTDPGKRAKHQIAILDDDSDMAHLSHRLVQTNFHTGLLDEHVERVIALLKW